MFSTGTAVFPGTGLATDCGRNKNGGQLTSQSLDKTFTSAACLPVIKNGGNLSGMPSFVPAHPEILAGTY